MLSNGLCSTCINSILCETWSEWKCKIKEKRIYSHEDIKTCSDYKKRGEDFKDPMCQCDDCLNNEKLCEEEEN